MRIAVLGDVHSNLAALEAVLADPLVAGCERLLHTGGIIGHGPHPNETIDRICARGIEGVRGHFEEAVAWEERPDGPAAGSREAGPLSRSDGTLAWHVRTIGFSQRQHLRDLPFSLQVRVGERALTLFHASPIDIYQGIEEDAAESWLEELAEETGADVHLFGHTHKPFHRVVGGRHFINAGSVGRPQDGDPRACVAVVEVDRAVTVTFPRIAYDGERAAREMAGAAVV